MYHRLYIGITANDIKTLLGQSYDRLMPGKALLEIDYNFSN